MLITAYFEYPSPDTAANALRTIPDQTSFNDDFHLVVGCRRNGKQEVVEVDFFNSAGTDPHPFSFPHQKDVAGIAQATGATRVTRNNTVIWPR